MLVKESHTIQIKSKTYGTINLELDYFDVHTITAKWKGFCIQSTNTKGKNKNPSLYPVVWRYENGNTVVRKVHSVLGIEVPKGFVIDHLDGNTFNNCRNNLEVITRAENTRRAQLGRRKICFSD